MIYLKIVLSALLSIVELFILTKIMGRRQISQLSLFDYINGITIGSIAAEMAVSPPSEMLEPAIAMLVYALIAICFSILSNKSVVLRRFLVGKSLVIMDNDKIYRNNLKKSGLDINEFLTQCRTNGYFDLNDLQTVIIEPNGQLSFLSKSAASPVKNQDMNIIKEENTINVVLISDGKIIDGNLSAVNQSRDWLINELKRQNYENIYDILIAVYDYSKLTVYTKEISNGTQDYFC